MNVVVVIVDNVIVCWLAAVVSCVSWSSVSVRTIHTHTAHRHERMGERKIHAPSMRMVVNIVHAIDVGVCVCVSVCGDNSRTINTYIYKECTRTQRTFRGDHSFPYTMPRLFGGCSLLRRLSVYARPRLWPACVYLCAICCLVLLCTALRVSRHCAAYGCVNVPLAIAIPTAAVNACAACVSIL